MKIVKVLFALCMMITYTASAYNVENHFPSLELAVVDTIPIKDNLGDFLNDPNTNPFDITPDNLDQTVEYDPETGNYVIYEKIGDQYIRTPSYMTFSEYMEWSKKKQQKDYFDKLSGVTSKNRTVSGLLDPMEKVDVSNSLINRLFGGTEVNIQPQGQVDIILESKYYDNFVRNNNRTSARYSPIVADMDINVSVDGQIGEKMKLNFNYDTKSTFDFDKKIKLDYDTESFGEDDIIQNIEAGDVSLPLKSDLIQGNQSLFGIKTQMKFGHLNLTAIMSQQRSQRNNIRIQNGASIQEIVFTPLDYDENRHFFISHYNRGAYEANLQQLPQVNTSFRILNLEVWISDDRPQYQNNSTPIVAVADIANGDKDKYLNTKAPFLQQYGPDANPSPLLVDQFRNMTLPDNRVNPIYQFLESTPEAKKLDQASTVLKQNGFVQSRDFEVFNGRKLNPNEFTFNDKLGFISLNVRLRPNQVLAVAYEYKYTANCNEIYKVGTITQSDGVTSSAVRRDTSGRASVDPPSVVFTKLIKSTQQPTNLPSYDLMMKNVYSLRTNQINAQDFKFDIFYEDDKDGSLKKYIPIEGLNTYPLLQLFNLDNLNRYNDPQPDGIFDFVPGVTIIPQTGTLIFPELEPFGKFLGDRIQEITGAKDTTFTYNDLYESSITVAKQRQEFNKFRLIAEVKSATSGEIPLGPFVPKGSVRVTAGGVQLVEGRDYEIDYSLGRLRIINDSYLQQGTPINVTFEDQALFSFQQKNMFGLRADYALNRKTHLGATILRLSERALQQKVNIGEDPIKNTVYGLDFTYGDEVPWVTTLVDKLPFYSTKEKSNINFTAEAAYLRPGHSSSINNAEESGGIVSIDDFEGAVNGLFLGSFNTSAWTLASTPADPRFPEHSLDNDLRYGANRALLNWYVHDLASRTESERKDNAYTRTVSQRELFDRQTQIGQDQLFTFDMSYYPTERGPYNFDVPGGYNGYTDGVEVKDGDVVLNNPGDRWAGIMRAFQNTDFEAANYEFIEFWMLNPFMERPDGTTPLPGEEGEIVFNLGNVSEDIIKDNLQFFENSLPIDATNTTSIKETKWGKVPLTIPVAKGFDITNGSKQDLGLNGLDDNEEKSQYAEYLNALATQGPATKVIADPAADNYEFNREDTQTPILDRMKRFNNPQGNAPVGDNVSQVSSLGNRFPDSEDLNNNRSLDQAEGFYKYTLKLKNSNGQLDTNSAVVKKYLTQVKNIRRSGNPDELWYRFRIPLSQPEESNNIEGFRSIQFMRMYMTGFERAKTFRLAEFQIMRNLWRRSDVECACSDCPAENVSFSVDEVGYEENQKKQPFGYVIPSGIKREQVPSAYQTLLQDEKSLSLQFCDLKKTCDVGINKLARLDLNLYKKLQLFVHAEAERNTEINNGDLSIYIKLGKDLVNHYYEYEMPLVVSDVAGGNTDENIWPKANKVDVVLDLFKEAKRKRIASGASNSSIFSINDPAKTGALVKVLGTPSMGEIKIVEIGVRNNVSDEDLCGEVWVNELRATGLSEKGGFAAQSRLQVQMADLGELNLSGRYSTIGWGSLDQRLADRNREELLQYDVATNLQLGKFFGKDFGLNLPFYAQYSRDIAFQQFEPYDGDLTPEEKKQALTQRKTSEPDKAAEIDREIADVDDRSKRQTTIRTFNFTNVKKNGSGKKPWSINNFSASYAYTDSKSSDEYVKEDGSEEHKGGLDYSYSTRAKYIQPFKKVKNKSLRLIKEFNFNLVPNRLTFSTNLNRLKNKRVYRLPQSPVFQFDDKKFFWDRNYGLSWDLTKALNFNFNAKVSAIVDELRQVGIAENPNDRKWVDSYGNALVGGRQAARDTLLNNVKNLGRSKNYNHNLRLGYKLPFRYIPYMEWINVKTDYKADYSWTAGSLVYIDPDKNTIGNTIQNKQTRSVNTTLNLDKLYNKFKYLKDIQSRSKKRSKSNRKIKGKVKTESKKDGKDTKKKKDKKPREVTRIEKLLIRPLLALRSVSLNYREDLGTVIPGFVPQAQLLGMSSGFSAPGWEFISGLQPNLENFLFDNKQWYNDSPNFSDQIMQRRQQKIDMRIALEPFRNFDIDIDFKKNYTRDHTEEFRFKGGTDNKFMRVPLLDLGTFEVSHWGTSTLFNNNLTNYYRFLENRVSVSHILAKGDTRIHSVENPRYAYGYGPESSDVLIPAFLSAYTGVSTSAVTKDLEGDVSKLSFIPKPNWSISYDGLSRLSFFKSFLTSFSLKHAYRSSLAVNRFATSSEYLARPGSRALNSNNNYYSEIEIPAVIINEQFSPLIGISMKTKGDFTLDADIRKSRQLQLSQQELSERTSFELTMGVGYIIKNIKSKSGKKRKSKRKKKDQEGDKKKKRNIFSGIGNKVDNNRGRKVTINLDFSIRDDVEYIYKYSTEAPPQPNSGSRMIQISPNVVYDINENLAFRFFGNFNDRRAKATVSIPRTLNVSGGIAAQLKIN